MRYLSPDPFPYSFYEDYLNTAEVQAAIGVFTNFSSSSSITGNAFSSTGDDARLIGVKEAVEYVIDSNVTFVMYFGDGKSTPLLISSISPSIVPSQLKACPLQTILPCHSSTLHILSFFPSPVPG